MNHVYRVVFNRALGLCQVVSELASAHGGAVAKAMCLAPRLSLLANACLLALGMTMVEVASAQTVIENLVLEVDSPADLTGDVTLGSNGELRGTADITLANHLTIEAATTPTISAATGTTLTLTGTANLWSGAGLAFGSAGHTGTVVISSPGFNSSGTRSALNINYGTLRIGNSSFLTPLEWVPSIHIAGGAILDFNDMNRNSPSTSINDLQGAGTLRTGALSDNLVAITGGTFNGVIEGAGGIEKRHSGTLTLGGVNTYSGDTTISDGTLALGAGGSLAATSAVNLSGADAGFDISAATADLTIGSLAGVAGSTVTLGARSLSTGGDNRSTQYTGAMTGTGSLTKTGSGTLTLTGSNDYGKANVSGGTLAIQSGGTVSSTGTGIIDGAVDTQVTVDGVGSTWTSSGQLGVGVSRTGTLTVQHGGKVSATNGSGLVDVALNATAAGAVNIGAAVGETALAAGTLEAGELRFGAGTGSLNFNHTDPAYIFDTRITGAGAVNQAAGTTLLTRANSYTGGTTVSGGTLVISSDDNLGAVTGDLTLDGGTLASTAGVNSTRAVNLGTRGGTVDVTPGVLLNLGGVISGHALTKTGGLVMLTADNTYTDTTISYGTLQVGSGGTTGTLGSGKVINNAALAFNRSDALVVNNDISGIGGFIQSGSGLITLTGTNTYTDTTTINAGTLQVGNGGTTGTLGGGNVINNASLVFSRSDALIVSNDISGTGALFQAGPGTTTLTGTNTYTSSTIAGIGTLVINGSVAGNVQVNTAGTLAGNGHIGGNVNVRGTLAAGNSPGTLRIAGNLALDARSTSVFELGQAEVAGGPANDLVEVGGDLTLGGTLQAQTASAGWYRLFNYGGTLSGGFDDTQVSSSHAGFTVGHHEVDTATANQVNLTVLAAGQSIQFWDGSHATPSGLVGGAGGAGSWSSAGTTWTNDSATTNSSWAGSVAHFGGTAGTVSIVGTQRFDTLQFASDGYLLTGDSLALSPASGSSATINTDAGVSATLASSLVNSGLANRLIKVGSGKLILSGANSYSGIGTQVLGGTLVVAHDSALGSHQVVVDDAAGDNATLQVNAGITLANSVFIDNNGTLDNYGAIVNAVTGGAGVKSSGGATINNAGGTIQAMDANGDGIRIDGAAGTVTNTGGGLITGEASGISINGNGAVINDAGTISGTGSSGDGIRIRGTGAVTNANGGLVTGQDSGVIMFDGGTLLNSGTISSADGRGVQIYDSTATITNTADGIISGVGDAVYLDGGGTLTNNGGAIISTGTFPHIDMHFIDGHGVYASQLATVNNIGGGTISSQTVGVGLYRGGSLTNGVGSTVQGTNGSFDVVSGDSILNNSGTMRGDVRMSDTGTHHVTLFDGSRIEGHLDIGNEASTLALGGTDSQLYTDAVTGSTYFRGQLLKQDSGTWRIDSALTDIKSTILSAGTLQIGDGGTNGAISGDVLNHGTLAFNRSDDVVFTGDISGSGAVRVLGSGSTTLSGNNSYSGGTTITAGTLAGNASNLGSGTMNIAATATLSMQQNSDASFSSLFSGSGRINKNGGGTLDVTGDSTAFTGTTHVNAGTLAVNGALGGTLNVHDGATLKGTGSVGSTVVMDGGTIAPGNSIGRLSVAGDLTFATGSTYQIEATPDGSADHIHASGTIALQGRSAMVLAADGSWSPSTTYQVLSADAGISGAFDEISTNFAFLTPTLANDGHTLSLTLARNQVLFPAVATTLNQVATSTAIESLGTGKGLYDAVVQLDEANAVSAFDQLSGEVHASVRATLIQDSRFVREAAIDRLRQREGAQDAASDLSTDGNAWGRMHGSWGRQDGDGNAARSKRSAGGIVAGSDHQFGNWNAGLVAAASHGKLDVDARRSDARIDSYQLGLYAGTTVGDALQLRGGALFGHHLIETDRTITFTGVNERNRADYHTSSVQAFGELGWKLPTREVELEPFANLAYVGMTSEGFREHAGISALSARKETTDTLFSTLGVRAGSTFSAGTLQANWRVMAGWRHAFNDVTGSARLSFATDGSSAFAINGLPVADDTLAIEAGVEVTLRPDLTVGAAYSSQHGDGARDHGLKANVTWVL
ncbi:autotransporter domain-containing protein [Stenotrophomonas sp. ISL-67]|uniref:autotransporter domain-containing protein n=1 Tax=Stenotrophomonas sp. ISL-67 TaxID=2819171 RepID=UPI001BEC910D|nr:autotransporter domain-containing protein [Stenotrophomonas sp. ISL-67]MBT2766685.1 autotransporter domain-containing protein [Stenotrophomonas sp. ISL-67]